MTWARCLYLSCCFQTTSKPAPRSKWTTTSSTSTVLLSAFILPPVICTDFCGSHDWSACMFLSVIADLFREQRLFSTYNSFKTTIAAAITSDNMRKNSQKDERNNNLARLYMHCAILSRLCWKKKKKIQYSMSEMEMLHHNIITPVNYIYRTLSFKLNWLIYQKMFVVWLTEDERLSVFDRSRFKMRMIHESWAIHSVCCEVHFLYGWSPENLSGFQ